MNNLKRFTVCKLAGHKWVKVAIPRLPTGRPQVPSCAVSAVTRRITRQERLLVAGAAFSSRLQPKREPVLVEDAPKQGRRQSSSPHMPLMVRGHVDVRSGHEYAHSDSLRTSASGVRVGTWRLDAWWCWG